jgi:SOS-response transcriptional repressor LexA
VTAFFTTVRSQGAILPPDLLQRIVDRDPTLGGLTPESYHLGGETIGEATSRAWAKLQKAWTAFREAEARLAETDLGTSLTRERWLLLLFQDLAYGRLQTAKAVEVERKSFPISHAWGEHTPIHLVGWRVDIDKRTPRVAGAAGASPHGLVQEFLNRSAAHLWGFVSNGFTLRLLRDNASLTRQAFVEFDLRGMFDGEVYADFVLLWLLCHQSRVEGDPPAVCWLERWSLAAREQGTRVLNRLRDGVKQAIEALGAGFLGHASNQALRERLQTGVLAKEDYYQQLLRVVYRLLFLMVAEDRGQLLHPASSEEARRCFLEHYSLQRLRRLAQRLRGTRHGDLWQGLTVVMRALGDDAGSPALGLPSLGSTLWARQSVPDLDGAALSNQALLAAVRALASTSEAGSLRPVDYRNLGAEELGSVYESLLELQPLLDVRNARFTLETVAGSERKTTGSYYTPSSLIDCLLDSALDPVLEEAASKPNPEQAILALKVCDPACGSGHFLIAAAQRIGKRLASVRTGELEPSPEEVRRALRDVVGHCIYGVDLNPMAAELCKVSLWLEAMEPGRPLSFLDHRIQVGNSLLGTTPALLAGGIPDEAFVALEGDDPAVVRDLKRRNKGEREGQTSLFVGLGGTAESLHDRLAALANEVEGLGDASIAEVHRKEEGYRRLAESEEYQRARLVADAWCTAFVYRRVQNGPVSVTQDVLRRIGQDPNGIPRTTVQEVERLAMQYMFFHWHLAFPEVFRSPKPAEETMNGFDVVLGNPPWEHTELKEKEWFATRNPEIASARTAVQRKRMIDELAHSDPHLHLAFAEAKRHHDGVALFLGNGGRFPLCGRGRINTYAVFAELMRSLLSSMGRVGCIVPSGIATDDTTKHFFQAVIGGRELVSLYDFENREGLFPAVDSRQKFCLITFSSRGRPVARGADFAFFLRGVPDLSSSERHFALTPEDIALLNPNTRTCPVFRSQRDAQITKGVYRRMPVLIREGPPEENPWGLTFSQGLFNMASDSAVFHAREDLEAEGWQLEGNVLVRGEERYLPLYEAKMVGMLDHRAANVVRSATAVIRQGQPEEISLAEHLDPSRLPMPRAWVTAKDVEERLQGRWGRLWLLCWRDVTSPTNERTVIVTVIPRVGVGHTMPLLLASNGDMAGVIGLLGNLASFVLDYVARQKVGGIHLTYSHLTQLPLLAPASYVRPPKWDDHVTTADWLTPRILELTYTAWDLQSFAKDCGWDGPPFRWDGERRALLRAEVDAAFFHLYGMERADVGYILQTFPIVKRNDERTYGEYRTERLILERYDALAHAIETGVPYQTFLNPPPADQRVTHVPAVHAAPAPAARVLPFRRLGRAPKLNERYVTAVPLLTLKAAAGGFGEVQAVEFDEWVEPTNPPRLQKGMFVAQVTGRSMEPEIPDASYCLFRYVRPGSREGKVVLVQLHGHSDPETGGGYTVKRYHSEKVEDEDGGWRHARIVLKPANPAHDPIVLEAEEGGEVKVVAELVKVL